MPGPIIKVRRRKYVLSNSRIKVTDITKTINSNANISGSYVPIIITEDDPIHLTTESDDINLTTEPIELDVTTEET
jgi:hypothetical protein